MQNGAGDSRPVPRRHKKTIPIDIHEIIRLTHTPPTVDCAQGVICIMPIPDLIKILCRWGSLGSGLC